MREAFNKRGRKNFLKKLGKDTDALKKRGFSDDQIREIQAGKVPKNYVVHHKNPLFRGGTNSASNLDLMKAKFHQENFQQLHYYDGPTSPFY
ncbi:HNH endonuclease signature motif containing protein [Flavobacterium sp. 140616W15]|uniref:HNH endonuclease signature motif containing protein n=1 Tax=Flavobacterium sp. 140616W15 TaxID=2478552 RepID=UPI001013CE51|nr:HNH endonuclease signature motif containing protein [Flavobacterium sp. 140616W15]